jgi:hypothetical protein
MPNKPLNQLSPTERIEYYLGKDRFRDRFWQNSLPRQWDIPARGNNKYQFFTPQAGNSVFTDKRDLGTEYRINDYGYRNHYDFGDLDLDGQKVIACFGCSNVYGSCVDYEDIWTTLLQKQLGDEYLVMNFGVPSLSNDGIARIGYRAMMALSGHVAAACVLWAPSSLREFVTKKFQSGVHILDNNHLPFDDWWEHIDWVSNNYNYGKNRALLESTSAAIGCDFVDLMINLDDKKYQFDLIEFGNYHAIGKNTHRAMADWYYKKLKRIPSLYEEISRP